MSNEIKNIGDFERELAEIKYWERLKLAVVLGLVAEFCISMWGFIEIGNENRYAMIVLFIAWFVASIATTSVLKGKD